MVWYAVFRSKDEYIRHYNELIAQYESLTAANTIEMYQL